METWNIQKVLHWTTQHFESKKITSARLDAELLLTKVLNCKRIDLYLKFDQPLSEKDLSSLKELIKRRALFEPMSYILGEKDFFNRSFAVGEGVLIPRPETEIIIEEVLKLERKENLKILDVATGTGCIAATLALELLDAEITAIDISEKAKEYSLINFNKHQINNKINFISDDFIRFSKMTADKFDLIVSNPPYISKNADLMPDVKNYEPAIALYGGEKGDEILKQWLPLMLKLLKPEGVIFCELGYDQKQSVSEILDGFNIQFIKDYSGIERIVKVSN